MEWQWHQLDHMRIICTSLQTDNHAITSPVTTQFLQAGYPSCRRTHSVKVLNLLHVYICIPIPACIHLHGNATTTTTVLRPFVWDYPGEPVPEETFNHPPSWSSSLYQLLPFTTIHSILPVQITCLAIFLHNLCLFLVFLTSPYLKLLSFTLTLHIHLTILVSTHWSAISFLQHAQCSHCKRCISYSNSVRPSVRHAPVLCQNDGT